MATDLSSLMQVAPYAAGGYIGIDQAQQEQMEQIKQQELAQLIQSRQNIDTRANELQPYVVRQHDLQNQETAARVPGVAAQSRGYGLDADLKAGTLQSDIDAQKFKTANAMRTAVFGQLGPYSDALEKQPAVARHSALDSYITQLGVPPDQKAAMMQHFANVPAEQLPAEVKRISDGVLRSNAEYAREIDKEKIASTSRERVANILKDSRENVQELKNDGRGAGQPDPDDIEGWLRASNKRASPATQLSNYYTAIARAAVAGNDELVGRLRQEAGPIREQVTQQMNAAQAGRINVPATANGTGGIVANPPVSLPPVDRTPPAPNPQAPSAAAGSDIATIQKVLQSRGEQYQPDKFNYRIVNGMLQKQPK